MKRLAFILALIAIIFIAHHGMIYFHEWVHGTAAWLTGYKSHPFAIHYGEKWITLRDIDEAVPYNQILRDGKPSVMAFIAIAPLVCQVLVFLLGLKLMNLPALQSKRWLFAFVYWFTFFQLAEIFSYIPIRSFAQKDDIYNFDFATGLSPWFVVIPGTLFVIWGIYRILTFEMPRACDCLKISSTAGRSAFYVTSVFFFFAYYGARGLLEPDPVSQNLSKVSLALFPLVLIALCCKQWKS